MFLILALLFQYTKLYDQTNIFVGNLQLSAFFVIPAHKCTVEFSKSTFGSHFCNFCDVSLVKTESKSNF